MAIAPVKAVRSRIRDAFVAMLSDLKLEGRKVHVRPYNGELGAKDADQVMQALNGLSPGILVATERGSYKGISTHRRRYRRDVSVVLYMVSTSQGAREDRADELAQLEDMVLARLTGVAPDGLADVAHGVLEPISEDVMAHDATVCIWKQEWSLTVECNLAERPSATITETVGGLKAPPEEDQAVSPLVQVTNLITPT